MRECEQIKAHTWQIDNHAWLSDRVFVRICKVVIVNELKDTMNCWNDYFDRLTVELVMFFIEAYVDTDLIWSHICIIDWVYLYSAVFSNKANRTWTFTVFFKAIWRCDRDIVVCWAQITIIIEVNYRLEWKFINLDWVPFYCNYERILVDRVLLNGTWERVDCNWDFDAW